MRVIEKSLRLFKDRGFDSVTIATICKECGIAKSTFYYHFDSKEDLLDDLPGYSESYVAERMVALADSKNYVEQLWNLYRMYIDPILEAGVEIKRHSFVKNLSEDKKEYAPGESALWEAELILVRKAQASGQILNTTDPESLVSSIIYAMGGTCLVWCIKDGKTDLAAEMRKVFESILIIAPEDHPLPE